MKITYYGHSCVELETNGVKLLFDPFISHNPLAGHIDVNSVKPNFILLSHGHADHMADLFTVQSNSGAKVICIADIAHWLEAKGIKDAHGMNIGGSFNFDFGRAKMVYALHSSSMPDGSYGGNPAGFVIYAEGKKVYFAGDTALTYDMKLLADENLDLAILPIGDNYTMGAADAVKTCEFINCKNVMGVHYDTFPPIKIDKEATAKLFADAGINLRLTAIGDSFTL